MRVFLFADGRLERDRLLRDLEHLAHLGHGNIHAAGNLFARRLAAQLLDKLAAGADELVDGLDHVHRDADGPGLVRNGAGDGLANPPGCVGRELVAAAVFKLVHGLHEADVALLNQVEELEAAVGVLFGDGDHQAQVGFDQFALGLVRVHVALDHLALGALQLNDGDARVGLDLFEIGLAVFLLPAVLLLQLFATAGLVLLVE